MPRDDEKNWRPFEPGLESCVRSESVTWVESHWSPYGLNTKRDEEMELSPTKGIIYYDLVPIEPEP